MEVLPSQRGTAGLSLCDGTAAGDGRSTWDPHQCIVVVVVAELPASRDFPGLASLWRRGMWDEFSWTGGSFNFTATGLMTLSISKGPMNLGASFLDSTKEECLWWTAILSGQPGKWGLGCDVCWRWQSSGQPHAAGIFVPWPRFDGNGG